MKPQIKKGKDWVKALRSGRFKQGTGVLYSPDDESYCCLGVYANIRGVSNADMEYVYMLDEVEDGMDEGAQEIFISLNDSDVWSDYAREILKIRNWKLKRKPEPYSFEEIADFLEENFELL